MSYRWYVAYGHKLIWRKREPLVKLWHDMRSPGAGGSRPGGGPGVSGGPGPQWDSASSLWSFLKELESRVPSEYARTLLSTERESGCFCLSENIVLHSRLAMSRSWFKSMQRPAVWKTGHASHLVLQSRCSLCRLITSAALQVTPSSYKMKIPSLSYLLITWRCLTFSLHVPVYITESNCRSLGRKTRVLIQFSD